MYMDGNYITHGNNEETIDTHSGVQVSIASFKYLHLLVFDGNKHLSLSFTYDVAPL